MLRQVLAIDLKDDSVVQTYREYHRRVWPEVLESLQRIFEPAPLIKGESYVPLCSWIFGIQLDGRVVRYIPS